MTKQETQKDEAVRALRKILKRGDTVYTVLRHVSSSGMSRRIDLYVIKKGAPRYLSGYAATALGRKRHPKQDGIVVGGCGMDMGFHLVYELSSQLFAGSESAGYALNHRWL